MPALGLAAHPLRAPGATGRRASSRRSRPLRVLAQGNNGFTSNILTMQAPLLVSRWEGRLSATPPRPRDSQGRSLPRRPPIQPCGSRDSSLGSPGAAGTAAAGGEAGGGRRKPYHARGGWLLPMRPRGGCGPPPSPQHPPRQAAAHPPGSPGMQSSTACGPPALGLGLLPHRRYRRRTCSSAAAHARPPPTVCCAGELGRRLLGGGEGPGRGPRAAAHAG